MDKLKINNLFIIVKNNYINKLKINKFYIINYNYN